MKRIDSNSTYPLDTVIFLNEMRKLAGITTHTIRTMIKNKKVKNSIYFHHRRFWLLDDAYESYLQILAAKKNNRDHKIMSMTEFKKKAFFIREKQQNK